MFTEIPCVLMRGGTSRGPYFHASDLPADPAERDRVLLAVMGSPHDLQLNGLGGGNSLTSKVAIVSRSTQPGCDIDYLFAQVFVDEARVDTRPNCGNMLAGVAPFAIEEGLVPARHGTTAVRIHNVNTGARIVATVQTPDGRVRYDGETRIDGVPGTGAPIALAFRDAWGGVTGALFPTGQPVDDIDGVQVTCIDAAMPLMIVDARSLGITGGETAAALDGDAGLLARIETLRRQAGRLMGLGDVSNSVVPKPVIVSAGSRPSAVRSRYFTPRRCHRSHAATGAIGVATAFVSAGTVANAYADDIQAGNRLVSVEHPAGAIDIEVSLEARDRGLAVSSASLIRTARKIMRGVVFVPASTPG